MIRLIASDLDGTLLYPKRRWTSLVYHKNRYFVRDFVRSGGRFVIATGRGLDFCQKIQKALRVPCDFIAYNGGLVLSDKKILEENLLDSHLVQDMVTFLADKKHKMILTLMTRDNPIVIKAWELSLTEKIVSQIIRVKNGRYHEKIINDSELFNKLIHDPNQRIYKFSLLFRSQLYPEMKALMAEIGQKFGERVQLSLMKNNIEINAAGVSKGSKLLYLTEHLGIAKEEVMVVGDDYNDVSMFQIFPNSFGIATGVKEAIQQASGTVKHVSWLKRHLK